MLLPPIAGAACLISTCYTLFRMPLGQALTVVGGAVAMFAGVTLSLTTFGNIAHNAMPSVVAGNAPMIVILSILVEDIIRIAVMRALVGQSLLHERKIAFQLAVLIAFTETLISTNSMGYNWLLGRSPSQQGISDELLSAVIVGIFMTHAIVHYLLNRIELGLSYRQCWLLIIPVALHVAHDVIQIELSRMPWQQPEMVDAMLSMNAALAATLLAFIRLMDLPVVTKAGQ